MSRLRIIMAWVAVLLAAISLVGVSAAAPDAAISTHPAASRALPVASSPAASASSNAGSQLDAGAASDASVGPTDGGSEAAADDGGVDAPTDALQDRGLLGDATPDAAEKVWASCTEVVPDGAKPPRMEVKFPARGTSGHAAYLEIVVHHGPGEKVFPAGFRIVPQSDAAKAITDAHFVFPDPTGPAKPTVETSVQGATAVTRARIPFVPLPPEPGRHRLTLPPVPITVARANGQVMTLCTPPETIVVDEPTANEPHAKPKPNPPPRHQRETWTLLRDITYGVAIGLALASVLGWLLLKWMRRPKPEPPPPPPRPPWEVALERLERLRASTLLQEGKFVEYVDEVSDTLRGYLGGRYGFDGLESTSDEVMDELRARPEAHPILDEVRVLLQEGDLVKFARATPTVEDCVRMLHGVESLVQRTTPRMAPNKESREADRSASQATGGNETDGQGASTAGPETQQQGPGGEVQPSQSAPQESQRAQGPVTAEADVSSHPAAATDQPSPSQRTDQQSEGEAGPRREQPDANDHESGQSGQGGQA